MIGDVALRMLYGKPPDRAVGDITEVAIVDMVTLVRNAGGILAKLNTGFRKTSKHRHTINTDTKLITLPAFI